MGGVESSAFSSLLRLFFQGKMRIKRGWLQARIALFFFSILSSAFSKEEEKEKESQKAENVQRDFAPFWCAEKGLRPVVLFSKKKEGQKADDIGDTNILPFPCFSLCFFIFLKSKKKSKGLRPVSCAERYPCSFSKEKEGQKTDNVRGSLRLQLVCGKNIHVLSSEKKEDQKADNIHGHRFSAFSPSLSLFFIFHFLRVPGCLRPASCVEAWFYFRKERSRAKGR